jgi:DNA-binding transcriptional ArsR family regulator
MNVEPKLIQEDPALLDSFVRRAAATSDALRALSHENRLMILSLLTGRERSVGELEQVLKLPQPAVSQQLARLRLDDLVSSRRDGRTIYYTAESAKLEAIYRDLGELLGYTSDSAAVFARIDAEVVDMLRSLGASPDTGVAAEMASEAHGDEAAIGGGASHVSSVSDLNEAAQAAV